MEIRLTRRFYSRNVRLRFYDISLINGCPPKIIWLRSGNKTTQEIAQIIASYHDIIHDFIYNPDQTEKACLEIE